MQRLPLRHLPPGRGCARGAVIPIGSFAVTAGATYGMSLTYQDVPGSIDITLASLDAPERLPPDNQTWLSHRLSWAAAASDRRAVAEVD